VEDVRAYLVTTGSMFSLLTLVHVWRMIVEGTAVASNPWWVLVTVASAVLAVWAWRLLRRLPGAGDADHSRGGG
jgi:hypothetical protein